MLVYLPTQTEDVLYAVWRSYMPSKSYRSHAGRHFYLTENMIWAGYWPVGKTEKNGRIVSSFQLHFFILSWTKKKFDL